MPRGFMDDLEGEVIDEKVHKGGFENRLGSRPQGFESLSLRQKPRIFRGFFSQKNVFFGRKIFSWKNEAPFWFNSERCFIIMLQIVFFFYIAYDFIR